jgi:leucyl aminopeptidase
MAKMKKDMGGAAQVLGLAHMIMEGKLNVELRVLLSVAENSISGWAFRPGDILRYLINGWNFLF